MPTRGGRSGAFVSPYQINVSYGSGDGSRPASSGADWFGPLAPMAPVAPAAVAGRQWDFPSGFNLNVGPRAGEAIGFAMLRGLAGARRPAPRWRRDSNGRPRSDRQSDPRERRVDMSKPEHRSSRLLYEDRFPRLRNGETVAALVSATRRKVNERTRDAARVKMTSGLRGPHAHR